MFFESATAGVRGQVTNCFANCHIITECYATNEIEKSYAADEAAA